MPERSRRQRRAHVFHAAARRRLRACAVALRSESSAGRVRRRMRHPELPPCPVVVPARPLQGREGVPGMAPCVAAPRSIHAHSILVRQGHMPTHMVSYGVRWRSALQIMRAMMWSNPAMWVNRRHCGSMRLRLWYSSDSGISLAVHPKE